jgi:hypothetical protein
MADSHPRIIELELAPIPPYTVDSAKDELLPLIQEALRDAGASDLLTNGEIQVEVRQTFPTSIVIDIAITIGSEVAFRVFDAYIRPRLSHIFANRKETQRAIDSNRS